MNRKLLRDSGSITKLTRQIFGSIANRTSVTVYAAGSIAVLGVKPVKPGQVKPGQTLRYPLRNKKKNS
jgi:hypothetical protein